MFVAFLCGASSALPSGAKTYAGLLMTRTQNKGKGNDKNIHYNYYLIVMIANNSRAADE